MRVKLFIGVLVSTVVLNSCKTKSYICKVENHTNYNLDEVVFGIFGFYRTSIKKISIPPSGYSEVTISYKKVPLDFLVSQTTVDAIVVICSDSLSSYNTENIANIGEIKFSKLRKRKENVFVISEIPVVKDKHFVIDTVTKKLTLVLKDDSLKSKILIFKVEKIK
jgi:hypothetical protein